MTIFQQNNLIKLGDKLRLKLNYYSWKSKVYTCDNCLDSNTCKYAYDDYNTNGDCLAEK